MDVTKLPLHPSPPSRLSGELLVDLLPHQSQALKWMIDHENPKLPTTPDETAVQFWTRQKGGRNGSDYWLNVATKTPQSDTPVLGRGGIVADGMGLGELVRRGRLADVQERHSRLSRSFWQRRVRRWGRALQLQLFLVSSGCNRS